MKFDGFVACLMFLLKISTIAMSISSFNWMALRYPCKKLAQGVHTREDFVSFTFVTAVQNISWHNVRKKGN
jgi:hypothetical protein